MARVILKTAENTATWAVEEEDGNHLWAIFMQVFKGITPVVTAGNVGGPFDVDDRIVEMKFDNSSLVTQATDAGIQIDDLIEELKNRQHAVCAYASRQGDGKTCDCKYWLDVPGHKTLGVGEMTGCCELRAAIKVLEALK